MAGNYAAATNRLLALPRPANSQLAGRSRHMRCVGAQPPRMRGRGPSFGSGSPSRPCHYNSLLLASPIPRPHHRLSCLDTAKRRYLSPSGAAFHPAAARACVQVTEGRRIAISTQHPHDNMMPASVRRRPVPRPHRRLSPRQRGTGRSRDHADTYRWLENPQDRHGQKSIRENRGRYPTLP
jgi:hypothetical protein